MEAIANHAASHTVDVTIQSFEQEVINASLDQLVMVDFWADWCGPCQSLGPVLEKLAAEYQGTVKLAKIDADKEQALAGQFGIRSLPTVVFLKDKQVVDHFMGVQPESEIRQRIDKLTMNPVDADCQAVEQLYADGQADEAMEIMAQLIQKYPENDQPKLILLNWLLQSGRSGEASQIAESLSDEGKLSPAYRAYVARLEMDEALAGLPAAAELEQAIAVDQNNLPARYQLAQVLMAEQRYAEAMDHLLDIVRRDRAFEDDGARKLMLKVFELLGGSGDTVNEYRSKLSRLLF